MSEQAVNYISGFWRRIGALCIDFAILGGIGFILGFFLESTFVAMGPWGRLVGFSIALIYFGLMNSKLSGGQTAGKTFLKIRVVDSSNLTISIPKSFARAFILTAPIFLNGAQFSTELFQSPLVYLFSIVVFGGLLSIVYLYVFNRITRQSLHDLLLGTFVVNVNSAKQELSNISKTHLLVVPTLFLAAAITPVFTSQFSQTEPFKNLLTTQAALAQSPLTTYATVQSGFKTTKTINSDTKTITYMIARIFLLKNSINDSALAREMALIVIKNFPDAKEKDVIQIILVHGYDIGIGTQWARATYPFNPSELEGYANPKIEAIKAEQ